jgi:adenylate kinase family enzyme
VRRILVYGVTGSGKTTLAPLIAERLGLPYHSIDDLTWEPGWVPVSEAEQRARVSAICAGDAWVIDSAYGIWADIPLARVGLIVGLDLPRALSLWRLLRRTTGNIIGRRQLCNGNQETWTNTFLRRDSILVWHFRSFARKRERMRRWQADPAMPEVVLLRSRAEVRNWLASLSGARQA